MKFKKYTILFTDPLSEEQEGTFIGAFKVTIAKHQEGIDKAIERIEKDSVMGLYRRMFREYDTSILSVIAKLLMLKAKLFKVVRIEKITDQEYIVRFAYLEAYAFKKTFKLRGQELHAGIGKIIDEEKIMKAFHNEVVPYRLGIDKKTVTIIKQEVDEICTEVEDLDKDLLKP